MKKSDYTLSAIQISLGGSLVSTALIWAIASGEWFYGLISAIWVAYTGIVSYTLYQQVEHAISRARIEEIDRSIQNIKKIQEALR